MANTIKYRYSFKAINGSVWGVSFHVAGYSSTTINQLKPTSDGFRIEWTKDSDSMYSAFLPATLTVGIYRNANSLALLNDIISTNDGSVIVAVEKVISNVYVTQWRGIVSKEGLSKPDMPDLTAAIEITAYDGFGTLETIEYEPEDIADLQQVTLLSFFQQAVNKLANGLNLADTDPIIKVASNVANKFQVGLTDYDPFGNLYVNEGNYIDGYTYAGKTVGENLYDILKDILTTFRLTLVQWGGFYYIVNQSTYSNVSRVIDVYTYDCTTEAYLSKATETITDTVQLLAGGAYTYAMPVRKIKQNIKFNSSIYGDTLIPATPVIGTVYSCGLVEEGKSYQIKLNAKWVHAFIAQYEGQRQGTVKLHVYVGSYNLKTFYNGDIAWDTFSTARAYTFSEKYKRTADDPFQAVKTVPYSCNITTPPIPAAADGLELFFEIEEVFPSTEDAPYTNDEPVPSIFIYYDLYNINSCSMVIDGEIMSGDIDIWAKVDNNAYDEIENDSITLGTDTLLYPKSLGRLYFKDPVSGYIVSCDNDYQNLFVGDEMPLYQLGLTEQLALVQKTVQMYAGNLYGEPNVFNGVLLGANNYMFKSLTFVANTCECTCEAYVMIADRTGITFENNEKINSGGSGSGSGTSTNSQTTQAIPQYWKRTGTTIEPKVDGDAIKTSYRVISSDAAGVNYANLDNGTIVKFKTDDYTSDTSYYNSSNLPTSGEILDLKDVQSIISGTIKDIFKAIVTAGENWTTGSKAIEWIIETVKSETTTLAQRLKITKDAEFRIGSTANYSQFNEDGKFRQEGTATTWEDLQIAGSMITKAGANDPTIRTFVGNTVINGFSASVMNEVFFSVQLTHRYKEGSTIEPHIHWSPLTSPASSQNVVWKFEYSWANATVAFPTVATLSVTAATGTVGNKHLVNTFGPISGTWQTISSILVCRLYRDAKNAADTYTGEAGLLSFDIHIEQDTLGSDTEYGK